MTKLPYDIGTIRELGVYLEEKLEQNSCDNLLFFTMEFIEYKRLPIQKMIIWMKVNNIECDCQVFSHIKKYSERYLYAI